MGIDWVTFIAQIVNLFVLVWLLKKFLYRPILEAVDKRQSEIMHRVNAAKKEHELAENEHQQLVARQKEFDIQKQGLFDVALKEAEAYKDEQLLILKKEVENLKAKTNRDMEKEREGVALYVRNFMAENFMQLAQKIMTDLSGETSLDKNVMLMENRIKTLSKEEKENIKRTLEKQKDIYITSSDTLSPTAEKDLLSFFNKTFDIKEDIQAHFKTNSDLILGIEMTIGDVTIEWHLKSYLEEYQARLNTLLGTLIAEE